MHNETALQGVIRVGEGRGFVVENEDDRFVITAAHCLPHLPVCLPSVHAEHPFYESLLGPLDEKQAVRAQCYFADPVADIAVLGPPNGSWQPEAKGYKSLLNEAEALTIAEPPEDGKAWLLSLENQWFRCSASSIGQRIWIEDAEKEIAGGTSGSPIVDKDGSAFGVVCTGAHDEEGNPMIGGPNPRLTYTLPGWFLHELGLGHALPFTCLLNLLSVLFSGRRKTPWDDQLQRRELRREMRPARWRSSV